MISYFLAAMMLLQSSPQQLDLICTGSFVISSGDRADETKPFNARYRLDLERMAWCWGDCLSVDQVNRASPMTIFLNFYYEGGNSEVRIDRATGLLSWIITSNGVAGTVSATCESAPYTGIPQPRF